MKIDFTGKEKTIIYILLTLVSLCLVFIVIGRFSERKYKRYYKEQIESLKKEKNDLIQKSNKRIEILRNDNRKKDLIIKSAYTKIDSLEKVKQKVKIKYEIKYKEIEKFNSEQVKKYWENEFKR